MTKIAWLFSVSFLKTIYFNIHFLPWRQAIRLPILLSNVRFYGLSGSIVIDSDKIKTGMVKIGIARWGNYWCQNEVSTFDMRGGKITFGSNVFFMKGAHLRIGKDAHFSVGHDSSFASNTNICCHKSISIGAYSHFGWDVTCLDTDFHKIWDIYAKRYMNTTQKITIGEYCWIGAKSMILKGTKLPDHTTVSAGSIVKGHFTERNTIVSGNPATIVAEGYCITEDFYGGKYVVQK